MGSLSAKAGSNRLQMDAATMTPAANPVSMRDTMRGIASRSRNTQAAPSTVPIKGISNP